MKKEEFWKKFKKFWKKFWWIVWKDPSLKGWIISLIFLFVIIKFVFFPILEVSTGTELPLVIVESCSMHHSKGLFQNLDKWWKEHEEKYEDFNINKTEFLDFSMKRGFTKGDILFVIGKKPEKIDLGDVIIFEAGYKNPIIHRVIKIQNTSEGLIFSTIGDNNNGQLSIETNIKEEQVIGKASVRLIPYLGWAKLVFFESKRPNYERGFCEQR